MSQTTYAVKYLRNADSYEGTAAVTFRDERPNLVIGGPAVEVTEEEYRNLSARGIVLEVVDKDEVEKSATIDGANEPDTGGDNLDEIDSFDELKQIAKEENIDLGGARSKEAAREAIRTARAERNSEEGVESLPATATVEGTTPPIGGGATESEVPPGTTASGGGTATTGAGT